MATLGEIWHYTTATGLSGILSEHVLWASSAAFMNDHRELRTGPAVLAKQLDDLHGLVDDENFQGFLRLARGMGTIDQTLSFVACACHERDSLTMWRNYTDEVGFAVRLDPARPLFLRRQRSMSDVLFPSDEKLLGDVAGSAAILGLMADNFDESPREWQDAIYSKREQDSLARECLQLVRAYAKDPGQQTAEDAQTITNVMLEFNRTLQRFKDEAFKHEQERRVVFPVPQPLSRCFTKFRTSKYGIVPYVELGLPAEEPEGAGAALPRPMQNLPILQIAVGPTPYPDQAVAGVRQLLISFGYGDVDVVSSKIPFRS
ncbi:DUF2971 domain-containing protein [Arthrobacter sp. B2a2-09]|uniref:DUF2971 domain-containing protein n=1 Tax=Arthrobacter sp. B2a2-09 TaxID=2952822 RepID=UPI0022CD516C|nr:hypothetical protein [Arthrobacter sp. B2a2-09]MCZ9884605.1 hypothetical protein [Arthrobacter sp. B2a2-09]